MQCSCTHIDWYAYNNYCIEAYHPPSNSVGCYAHECDSCEKSFSLKIASNSDSTNDEYFNVSMMFFRNVSQSKKLFTGPLQPIQDAQDLEKWEKLEWANTSEVSSLDIKSFDIDITAHEYTNVPFVYNNKRVTLLLPYTITYTGLFFVDRFFKPNITQSTSYRAMAATSSVICDGDCGSIPPGQQTCQYEQHGNSLLCTASCDGPLRPGVCTLLIKK